MSHSISFVFAIGQSQVQDQHGTGCSWKLFDYLNILHDFRSYCIETIVNYVENAKYMSDLFDDYKLLKIFLHIKKSSNISAATRGVSTSSLLGVSIT
jgi:uncharacterized LabA/DUF88 family protein